MPRYYFTHLEVTLLGRKNKRKRSKYRDWLGFDPRKFVRYSVDHDRKIRHAVSTPVSVGIRMPKRGDVWFADLGTHPGTSVQDGCRPVFIISNDIGNQHADTINVLPMTRHLKRQSLPCHTQIEPGMVSDTKQSLAPSMILAEQVTTISKSALRHYTGHVEDPVLLSLIEQAVSMQLGLAESKDAGEEKGARV